METECESCGYEIEIPEDAEAGELLSCHDCGKEYEIKSINPVKLAAAPEIEEDWGE